MSSLVPLSESQLPAHITGGSEQAVGLVTSESVPRISLKDAGFVLKKDGNEIKIGLGKPIKLVLLGIDPPEPKRTSKQWYAGGWTEDSAAGPDCYSNDGVRPDSSIANPQCSNCAQCPKNAWGSGVDAEGSPSKGKACSDRKNLLVVIGGKYMDGDVFRLSVPPTSLKALSNYGRELVRYNVNMHKVVTQIDVDPDNSKGMLFSYAGFLEEADAGRMDARAGSPEILEMIHKAPVVDSSVPSLEHQAPAVEEDDELDLDALGSGGEGASPAAESAEAAPVGDVDSSGVAWSADLHSSTKTKVGDGTWKKKRKSAKAVAPAKDEPAPIEAASEESDSDDLDDIMSNWGAGV